MAAGGLLVLRAGGEMHWEFNATFRRVIATVDTPDGPRTMPLLTGGALAVVRFSKLAEKAAVDGSNLPPGFATWADRGMEPSEPSFVQLDLDTFGVSRIVRLPTPGVIGHVTGFDSTDFTSNRHLLFDHGELFALHVIIPSPDTLQAVPGEKTVFPWVGKAVGPAKKVTKDGRTPLKRKPI